MTNVVGHSSFDATPIYAVLAGEMTAAPLCQICGRPDLERIEQQHWLLCLQCWMRGYGYAGARKAHTCKVCGKFPLEFEDHMVRVRATPDADGCTVDYLCRRHFDEARAA